MEKNAKIYVAGHRGMVGSAIVRELQRQGYTNIITRTHKELDRKPWNASSPKKSPNMYSSPQQRWAVSSPTNRHWRTSCTRT